MTDIFLADARSTAVPAQQFAEALRALSHGVRRDDDGTARPAYAHGLKAEPGSADRPARPAPRRSGSLRA